MFSFFLLKISRVMSIGRSQVEINPFARAVLQKRMQEGFLHEGTIHDDVTTFQVPGKTEAFGAGGGFPCQVGHGCCYFLGLWLWFFLMYFYLLTVPVSGNLLWWTPTRASGPEKRFAQAGVQDFRSASRATKARSNNQAGQVYCTLLIFRHHVQAVYLFGEREEHFVQAEGHDEAHAIPDQGSSCTGFPISCVFDVRAGVQLSLADP